MVQVKLEGGLLADVAFSGRGCAISQAAASILTEVAKGRPLEWVEKSSDEDIFRMLGIGEHRKARVPCELLGIRALKNGASTYNDSRPSTPR
jgi:nitrogen fixation NifU-like protein